VYSVAPLSSSDLLAAHQCNILESEDAQVREAHEPTDSTSPRLPVQCISSSQPTHWAHKLWSNSFAAKDATSLFAYNVSDLVLTESASIAKTRLSLLVFYFKPRAFEIRRTFGRLLPLLIRLSDNLSSSGMACTSSSELLDYFVQLKVACFINSVVIWCNFNVACSPSLPVLIKNPISFLLTKRKEEIVILYAVRTIRTGRNYLHSNILLETFFHKNVEAKINQNFENIPAESQVRTFSFLSCYFTFFFLMTSIN